MHPHTYKLIHRRNIILCENSQLVHHDDDDALHTTLTHCEFDFLYVCIVNVSFGSLYTLVRRQRTKPIARSHSKPTFRPARHGDSALFATSLPPDQQSSHTRKHLAASKQKSPLENTVGKIFLRSTMVVRSCASYIHVVVDVFAYSCRYAVVVRSCQFSYTCILVYYTDDGWFSHLSVCWVLICTYLSV